jgi:predicted permease
MTRREFGRGVRPGVRRLFRLPLRTPARAHADADAELDSYIESRIEYFVARGMSPAQARLEAMHRLGGSLSEVRAMLHHSAERREQHMRFTDALDDVVQDIRFAARGLRRQPGFAIAAVACLAIGIGANTTMVGIVDALLLRSPTGVHDPASVLWINAERTTPFGFKEMAGLTYPDYVDFSRSSAIAGAAAYHAREELFGSGADVRQINSLVITPTFMPLLGAKPALGRLFTADEDRPGVQPLIVLGYDFWQSQFAGAKTILGQPLQVGGITYTIIGVAPRGFNGVERSRIDVFTPSVGRSGDLSLFEKRESNWLTVLARARPGVARVRIAEELGAIYHRAEGGPRGRVYNKIVVASPMETVAMHSDVEVRNATLSIWLAAVAAIVLVIACTNVASLLLTRAARRRREIAVRLALGIGRGRLIRMLMTESLLIAVVGGVAGLVVARWGGSVFRASLIPKTVLDVSTFDTRMLVLTMIATVLTGVACGLAPAIQATRPDLTVALKAGEQGSTVARSRVLSGFFVGQLALTLVLLLAAGLFVRSLRNLDVLDLGFDVQQVLRARIARAPGSTPVEADQLSHQLLERTRALPGVEAAALATAGPFGNGRFESVRIPGQSRDDELLPIGISAVTPGFFAALGVRLERGRLFTDADRLGTAPVAVVNEAMVQAYWGGANPVGKCFKLGREPGPCITVIGVVANARQGNITRLSVQYERPRANYYPPLEQEPLVMRNGLFGIMLYVRSSGDAASLVPAVRRIIPESNPNARVPDVMSFAEGIEPQIRPWRLGVLMFGLFGAIALVLAVVGLYGVLAFRVSERQREIGVRISLGATRAHVQRLVLGEGLRLSALGVAIGVVVALTIGRALSTIVFGVSPRDPVILALTGAVLLAVAAIASAVPAWRATQIDPMRVLRDL